MAATLLALLLLILLTGLLDSNWRGFAARGTSLPSAAATIVGASARISRHADCEYRRAGNKHRNDCLLHEKPLSLERPDKMPGACTPKTHIDGSAGAGGSEDVT
jgi:hypothetical protein